MISRPSHLPVMYHTSVCGSSVRPFRFQRYRGRCPTSQAGSTNFEPQSLYTRGLDHGLSFDPTNTHALLCAFNALQSTKEPRWCPLQTSSADLTRQSCPCSSSKSSNSSDSLTAPSNPAPIPCSCGPPQPSTVEEGVQTSSCNSTFSTQENFTQGMGGQGSSNRSLQVQAGVGNSSKGLESNGLTWIDWGWPGAHTPCPFNPRHTVDDILIRPERISCERSKGKVCKFCPFIGKLVRCCKLSMRQLCKCH